MTSKLDSLLDAIAPEHTLEDVAACVDDAMNSFTLQPKRVETWGWDEFEDFTGEFLRHVVCTALLRIPPEDQRTDHIWPMFSYAIDEAYAPQGQRLALKLARTGAEGGIYAVMRKTGQALVNRWAHNRISSLVSEYWNGLSDKEKRTVPGEYLQRCGDLLPADVQEKLKWTPWFNFFQILEQHPRLLQRMRPVRW